MYIYGQDLQEKSLDLLEISMKLNIILKNLLRKKKLTTAHT